jgi:EAL domain-containing protein (putative c-di-GMP-specific phosphodiesterase class I)
VLGPERFIPQSEANGLIVGIGKWVLGEACRERARWRDAGVPVGPIAVNVSARELARADYRDSVLAALEVAGLEPRLLQLEITESAKITSFDRARRAMQSLRAEGISVALDDFGTGYSSLHSLRFIDVDQLKIPIDFIRGVGEDPDCDAVLDAMLSLGHRLGLTLVAEGVETATQLELLRERGCDQVQGNFLCPAAPPREARRWIEDVSETSASRRSGFSVGRLPETQRGDRRRVGYRA